jgi:hypothetical protein
MIARREVPGFVTVRGIYAIISGIVVLCASWAIIVMTMLPK